MKLTQNLSVINSKLVFLNLFYVFISTVELLLIEF